MRKYKINKDKDQKLPPAEVINKYKDFDKLRMQYSDITKRPKKPLYKNRRLFLFLLMVGLVAWLVYEAIEEDKKKEREKEATKTEIKKGE